MYTNLHLSQEVEARFCQPKNPCKSFIWITDAWSKCTIEKGNKSINSFRTFQSENYQSDLEDENEELDLYTSSYQFKSFGNTIEKDENSYGCGRGSQERSVRYK